jgi:hypothetical protein
MHSYCLVYAIGAVFAWRSGRRIFAAVTLGILAIYPLTLATLTLVTPILANRVFIPCVIPASMLFGVAVASLRRPVAQMALLTVVLLLAAWSEVEAYRLRVKPEDMPQALALVDAHGFAGAPILSCHFLAAGTAHLYAPDRAVFFPGAGNELIQFNDRILGALSLPLRQQRNMALMRSFLKKNDLIIDPATAWTSVERVVFNTTGCNSNSIRFLEQLLTCLGFRQIDAPILTRPERDVIEVLATELSLWSRSLPHG